MKTIEQVLRKAERERKRAEYLKEIEKQKSYQRAVNFAVAIGKRFGPAGTNQTRFPLPASELIVKRPKLPAYVHSSHEENEYYPLHIGNDDTIICTRLATAYSETGLSQSHF